MKLTFDYETLTPVRTTCVFNENSHGWEYVYGMLGNDRDSLEVNGSIGGGHWNYHLFEKDVPEFVKQPPQNLVQITGIELHEEDEEGNKTEPRKLQYKDFPTSEELEKIFNKMDTPNTNNWEEDRNKITDDMFFNNKSISK